MPTYQYKARDVAGKAVNGLMGGESKDLVAAKLKELGYLPFSIKELKGYSRGINIFEKFNKVKLSEINMFTRQFATLQKAGVSILLSLETLAQETINKKFKKAIEEITREIETGSTLSSALSRHPKIFGLLYANMVKTGEASGKLSEALNRLADLGEYEEKINMQIKAATRYPILVVVAIVVGFLVLTTLVIPRFANIYSQFTVKLPLPTQILLWLNFAIKNYWWFITIILLGLIAAFIKIINTKKGRFWWDGILLRFPVLGPLMLKITMSRFSRITGSLLQSGVPLFQILDLVSAGIGNSVIAAVIENIKKSISEGKDLSEPMRVSGMFTPTVIQMVKIGEQSGKLDELLLHISSYYDSRIEYTINNLTSLIEPILIFILGLAVLAMALGIFLPMWNLMSLFR